MFAIYAFFLANNLSRYTPNSQKNGSMAANGVLKYWSSNENGNMNSTIQNNIINITRK